MTDGSERPLPEVVGDVVYNRVSDGAVLLSTDAEVYFGLNETGARIWEHLRECDTVAGLCRALEGEYPEVEPDTIRADVEELLEELAEHGLLRGEDEDGGAARQGGDDRRRGDEADG